MSGIEVTPSYADCPHTITPLDTDMPIDRPESPFPRTMRSRGAKERQQQRSPNPRPTKRRRLRTPILRLPSELLTHIISLALWPDASVTLDTTKGIWPLTRICHRIRDLVLNNPLFWNELRIGTSRGLSNISPADLLLKCGTLRTILEHSNNQPLTIEFVAEEESALGFSLLDLLMKKSQFWRKIVFNMTRGMALRLNEVRGSIPLLFDVEMSREGDRSGPASHNALYWLEDAPSLRHVKIWRLGNITLPSSQLTSIHATTVPVNMYRYGVTWDAIKRTATTLKHLWCDLPNAVSDPDGDIDLLHLEALKLRFMTGSAGSIRAPNIQQLVCDDLWDHNSLLGIRRMVLRETYPHLQMLILGGKFEFGEELMEIIRAIPTLEELALSYVQSSRRTGLDTASFVSDLLDELTFIPGRAYSHEQSLLSPKLTALKLVFEAAKVGVDHERAKKLWESRTAVDHEETRRGCGVATLEMMRVSDMLVRFDNGRVSSHRKVKIF